MNGALHISANFDVKRENSIERANEIFAIALAGMIGQNIELIIQNELLFLELSKKNFNQIFDKTGCGGDFEIANKFLFDLGKAFNTNEVTFVQYKVLDLVMMFQNHCKVQELHMMLSNLLIEKGTLTSKELIDFFTQNNFQDYIENENLDLNFFHKA
jgi:hypothetical protein